MTSPSHRLSVAFFRVCIVFSLATAQARAAEGARVVVDAEVAHALAQIAQPLLPALGTTSERIKLHVLWKNQVNAFVGAGAHVVLHSGLIRAVEDTEELQAVLAHEFGHVLADHYALTVSARARAQRIAMLLMLGSLPLIAISGEAALAGAVALPQAIVNLTLAEQRTRETVADNSAIRILERAALSPRGTVSFLKKLGEEKATGYARYLQTHPATQSRIAFLKERVARSPFALRQASAANREAFARMKAKIDAFTLEPALVLQKYARKKFSPSSTQALAAGLARAVAFYRQRDTRQALREVAALLQRKPDDPFFFELKGDILRIGTPEEPNKGQQQEQQQAQKQAEEQAQVAYRKALNLLEAQYPNSYDLPMRMSLFDSLLALNALEAADSVMRKGLAKYPQSILARRKLAQLYDRQGRHAERALVWAEALWLGGERGKAYCNAKEAMQQFPPDSPQRLRAEDLTVQVQAQKKRGERFACS